MRRIHLATGISNVPDNADFTDIYTIFPDSFMQNYTKCKNIIDFCNTIGLDIGNVNSENQKIDSGAYDALIHQYSVFESWDAMCEAAIQYHKDLSKDNRGDK